MEELLSTFALGILEMLAWMAYALLLSVIWCLWMTLVVGGRLGLGVVRVGQRAFVRRAAQRELAGIALEYQAAITDIRRMSDSTRERLRTLSRIERG